MRRWLAASALALACGQPVPAFVPDASGRDATPAEASDVDASYAPVATLECEARSDNALCVITDSHHRGIDAVYPDVLIEPLESESSRRGIGFVTWGPRAWGVRTIRFFAAAGEDLAVGHYGTAGGGEGWPSDLPVIDFECPRPARGSFIVHQLEREPAPPHRVVRAKISFEHTCDPPRALPQFGQIAFAAETHTRRFDAGVDLLDAGLDAELDGGELDAGADGGVSDANVRDANVLDANVSDANVSDANVLDANVLDANVLDANVLDANVLDATVETPSDAEVDATPEAPEAPKAPRE